MKRVFFVAALSLGVMQFMPSAEAATAFIDGNIYWGAGTPATAYSYAGEVASFSFDVTTPTASNPVSVTDFDYTLNNSAVSTSLSNVEFYPSALDGGLDLNFTDGHSVTIYTADIGSGGTIGPSGYYAATAAIDDALPGTGVGGVAVAVSTVPLPAALPLLGSAVLGLGVIARRRKHRAV